MERRINFDHGSGCGCGSCGPVSNSYNESLKGQQGPQGPKGPKGDPGTNNLLVGGITNSSGVLAADGTDEAIDATAKSNLATAGFNIEAKPTTANVADASDTSSNKIWTGISRALLNFIGLHIIPARVPTGGAANDVLMKVDGTNYNMGWATPTNEVYNSVTTTPFPFNEDTPATIGTTVEFTVGTGKAYRFKNVVAIAHPTTPLDKYIEGVVEDYTANKITVRIMNMKGSGNTEDYNVMLSAPDYLPNPKDPNNFGKYLYNNNGVWELRISLDSVGDTKPWHNPVIPAGWLSCDGTTFTQTQYPLLFEHLRPGGAATKYAFQTDGVTALPAGTARVPAYNSASPTGGAMPYGVDGTTVKAGTRFGQNILTGGIPEKNLPVNSPWVLNDPGHDHDLPDGNDTPGSGGGFPVTSNTQLAPVGASTNASGTGITLKTNNIAGGKIDDGGQDFDKRPLVEGATWIIKAE